MDDPKPTIEDLVSQITPENLHGPMDWGPPVGREFGAPPPQDPSFERTRLLYRLSIALIILNTLILCTQIITNR